MPMLTTLRMRLPVWPVHSPLPHPIGECGHAVEHGVHGRHDSMPSTTMCSLAGARRATCNTARSSVTLILSPRNIASMRSGTPRATASANSSRIVSSVMRFLE